MLVRAARPLSLIALAAALLLLASGCGSVSSSSEQDDSSAKAAAPKAGDEQSPEEAGEEYEAAVLPLIDELQPLLQRWDSVSDKLLDGSIDVARATESFGKQAATARDLAAQVRAVEVGDDHLDGANEDLAKAFDAYGRAMIVYTSFDDSMSDAQINATFQKGNAELDSMFASLDTWSDALVDDPEGRDFTKTGEAFDRLSKFTDAL